MKTTSIKFFVPSICLILAALAGASRAADSDLSNLDKEVVVKKPVLTRSWSPRPQGTPKTAATRSYQPTRGIVVVEEVDGTVKELPYVVLPILFKVDSDRFLNAESEANVQRMAVKLQEPQLHAARFVVEGHTSAEGDLRHNQDLSERRASRIIGLLVSRYGIESARLVARGFGPMAPEVQPELTEEDRQHNRRVLIVKETNEGWTGATPK